MGEVDWMGGLMSYDFEELSSRWVAAKEAAKECASIREEEQTATLGLFLGSLISEGFDELASVMEAPDVPLTDDPLEYRSNRDDDREVSGRKITIVLKGRHPVSILGEVCQARGWPLPEYDIKQVGGESHTPVFAGSCSINGDDALEEDPLPFVVQLDNGKSKAELKKALATKMLIDHFDAREDY